MIGHKFWQHYNHHLPTIDNIAYYKEHETDASKDMFIPRALCNQELLRPDISYVQA